jgi:hypothetical protein
LTAVAPPSAELLRLASERLPGRTPLDCLRFWQSGEAPSLLAHAGGAAGGGGGGEKGDGGGAEGGEKRGATEEDEEGARQQLIVRSVAGARQLPPSAAATRGGRAPPRLRAGPAAGGGGAASLLRRDRHPARRLLEWRWAGGGGRAALGSQPYAAQLWRSLHEGFAPSSVCSQPTGNVTDLAFSPVRRRAAATRRCDDTVCSRAGPGCALAGRGVAAAGGRGDPRA